MTGPFDEVQRIVLHGKPGPKQRWTHARHLMVETATGPRRTAVLRFFQRMLQEKRLTPARDQETDLQYSIGFTRRGLEQAHVPAHVLGRLALKAPAFWAGATLRAASRLGMTGVNGARVWSPAFGHSRLDAVISVHATDACVLDRAVTELARNAQPDALRWTELPIAADFQSHDAGPGQQVHFGLRDGLSHIGIEGWTDPTQLARILSGSRHQPGEFLLGHRQDCGSTSWTAGPGPRVWATEVRAFFRNASFGVLQQIHQDVDTFERYVGEAAVQTGLTPELVKAKLCGRYPDGRPLSGPADPLADFDHRQDTKGYACPFGSHIRRMNPRLRGLDGDDRSPGQAAHFARARPLIRRGMPYGPAWRPRDGQDRGLIGHFFCASIEDQYEHLVGEWAERVPLGSPDQGRSRDPLTGNHDLGDGPFVFSQDEATRHRLTPFPAFTRTLGVAYLFYPSLSTLQGMAASSLWGADRPDDEA